MAAVTLTRGRKTLRLEAADGTVTGRFFDGDPDCGGQYRGSVTHPVTTLERTAAIYESRGWQRAADTTDPETDH